MPTGTEVAGPRCWKPCWKRKWGAEAGRGWRFAGQARPELRLASREVKKEAAAGSDSGSVGCG